MTGGHRADQRRLRRLAEKERAQLGATPLGDASNRGSASAPNAPASKQQKTSPAAAGVAPPPPPAAKLGGITQVPHSEVAPSRLPSCEAGSEQLPGLEEDGLPPFSSSSELPLTSDDDCEEFVAFGNIFVQGASADDGLRVTSISRTAAARRISTLRLVVQPDATEGWRASRLPPQERPSIRARTLALPQASSRRGSTAPNSSSQEVPQQESSGESASPTPPTSHSAPPAAAASRAESVQQAVGGSSDPAAACSSSQGMLIGAQSVATLAGPAEASSSCGPLPPPLPVEPGMGPAARRCLDAELAPPARAAAPGSRGEAAQAQDCSTAVYSGVCAEDEAAAAPAFQVPAWLAQQGCRNQSGTWLQPPSHLMAVDSQSSAAMWRSMWLSGLQWHNACRTGQPVRVGSKCHFIPVDPNEPMFEYFMLRTCVMPEHIIAGAARFEDILLSDQELYSQALRDGVFSFGVWGVAAPDGTYRLLADGKQMALPISFRCAAPHTIALFLACVWHEANRAETQHLTHTFTAAGDRLTDERCLKYPLSELQEWIRLAVGCKQVAHDSLAALQRMAVFGTD